MLSALLPAVASLTLAMAAPPSLQTVHIAGDSTAQTYKPDKYPSAGWGQLLQCAFGPGVTVRNHAIGGRSTRSFIAEGRFDRIRQELKRGDTLLIQFGHNDANTVRPGRFAAPQTAYRDNLRWMIATARAAGVQPVLLTPVIRRNFHDGRIRADFAPWSNQVRLIAREWRVPLIDLEAESAAWVQRIGPEAAKRLFLHYTPEDRMIGFPKGIADDTHFSELGARGVAEIIARELRELRLPVSSRVLRRRPALTRAEPLGRNDCQ